MSIRIIFLILAVVCWALDAFNVNLSNIKLFSLGWAFAGISFIV